MYINIQNKLCLFAKPNKLQEKPLEVQLTPLNNLGYIGHLPIEFWSRYMKLKKSRIADGISRLSTKNLQTFVPRGDFRKKNWTKTRHKQHGQ
jgi:hypothetical protein